jgi:hypothetical protein
MSELQFLAVHGLAVRKAAGPAAVADLLGANQPDIESALDDALKQGWAVGAAGKFMVSPAGQAWLSEQYPLAFAAARQDSDLEVAYERFEKVNTDLLALFTDWQTVPTGGIRVPNDHADPDYDRRVIDRLGTLHDRAERCISRCAASEPRLTRYLERLSAAYDRVLAGELGYMSGVRVDSYHTVWFELHEDLLRMLGRTRREQ